MINLILEVLIFLPIVIIAVGLLVGLLRGTKKSFVRMITMISVVLLTFIVTPFIADGLYNLAFIQDLLKNSLPSNLPPDIVHAVAKGILSAVLFLVLILILLPISFVISRIFTKKAMHKGRLIGGAIGLVGAVVLSFAVMTPINGLMVCFNSLETIMNELNHPLPESLKPLTTYNNKVIPGIYAPITNPLFNILTHDLEGDMAQIAKSLEDNHDTIQEILASGFTPDNIKNLGPLLDSLASINMLGNMTINDLNNLLGGGDMMKSMLGGTNMPPELQTTLDNLNNAKLSDFNFTALTNVVADATSSNPQMTDQQMLDALQTALPPSVSSDTQNILDAIKNSQNQGA